MPQYSCAHFCGRYAPISGSPCTIMECVRRSVPNDNSCLFYAVAYLVDGPDAVSDATQKELRRVCADWASERKAAVMG